MGTSRKQSEKLWKTAQGLIPGGVNSPVRAFGAVGGDPVFVESAVGCCIRDVDGAGPGVRTGRERSLRCDWRGVCSGRCAGTPAVVYASRSVVGPELLANSSTTGQWPHGRARSRCS